MVEFLEAIRIKEEADKQKSRVQWLEAGDKEPNISTILSKVELIERELCPYLNLMVPPPVMRKRKEESIKFFKSTIGTTAPNPYPRSEQLRNIVRKRISSDDFDMLETIPNDDKIKDALFSINGNKVPGKDGFNAHFFKHSWNLVAPL